MRLNVRVNPGPVKIVRSSLGTAGFNFREAFLPRDVWAFHVQQADFAIAPSVREDCVRWYVIIGDELLHLQGSGIEQPHATSPTSSGQCGLKGSE